MIYIGGGFECLLDVIKVCVLWSRKRQGKGQLLFGAGVDIHNAVMDSDLQRLQECVQLPARIFAAGFSCVQLGEPTIGSLLPELE